MLWLLLVYGRGLHLHKRYWHGSHFYFLAVDLHVQLRTYFNRVVGMQMPGLINRLRLIADGRTATGFLARQHLVVCGTLRPEFNFKYPPVAPDVPQLRLVFIMASILNAALKEISEKMKRRIIMVPNPNTAGATLVASQLYEK